MKNNYYSIDYTISPQENLKRLVNQNFQKEISFDVLRNNPPDYSDLKINNIKFKFIYIKKYFDMPNLRRTAENSNQAEYIKLSTYLHKGRKRYSGFTDRDKIKSLKIQKGKVNLNYLRKNFEDLKALKENDETEYQKDESIRKERNDTTQEIKTRYNIAYPESGLSIQDFNNKLFQLSFNKITEDQIRMLMTYYQQIKT